MYPSSCYFRSHSKQKHTDWLPREADPIGHERKKGHIINVGSIASDSLYARSIRGGEGRYGFDDIIENYGGTPAADLASFSAGMAYLNMKDYNAAIEYLNDFSSDDILLSALAKGAIGDAYAQLDQSDQALSYYSQAIKASENAYTSPKYLFKAGLLSNALGKNSQALSYFKRIKNDYPTSCQFGSCAC